MGHSRIVCRLGTALLMLLLPTVVTIQSIAHIHDADSVARWYDPASEEHRGHDHSLCVLLRYLLLTQVPADANVQPVFAAIEVRVTPPRIAVFYKPYRTHQTWPRAPPTSS